MFAKNSEYLKEIIYTFSAKLPKEVGKLIVHLLKTSCECY